MLLGKFTARAAALTAVLLLAACAGGGDQGYYVKKCTARGLTADAPGWQACLNDEQATLEDERSRQNSIRWGI